MNCKNIIFDVDGILIDSMPIWENSANLYLEQVLNIIAYPELDAECATMSLLEAGEYIKGKYPQIVLTKEEIAQGVAEFIRERYWQVGERPYMCDTVEKLYSIGYNLYLATASERENVEGALKNLGVYSYFKELYTCTEIGYSKSYTKYYELVSEKIGVPCNNLIMVEDSLHSMVTAKEAGLTVVGVFEESSAKRVNEIKKVCDVYLQDLSQLPVWLESED